MEAARAADGWLIHGVEPLACRGVTASPSSTYDLASPEAYLAAER